MSERVITRVETTPLNLTDVEPEFGKACETCPHLGRDSEATWALWVSHARDICPGYFYSCEDCRAGAEQYWIAVLKNGWGCMNCGPVSGQLSDNLRWIKL